MYCLRVLKARSLKSEHDGWGWGVSSFAGFQEEYPRGSSLPQLIQDCLYVVAFRLRQQKRFTPGQEVEENLRAW